MAENIHTTVLDAGGRFGLHPTWKGFTGELRYYLFEPDPSEAKRLRVKYKGSPGEVTVVESALSDSDDETRLFLFRNRAMSSSHKHNLITSRFLGERRPQLDIVGHVDAMTTTVDCYCEEHGITLDFMKLDTEGNEYAILQGAKQQLTDNVLGVRCEVTFDNMYDGMPGFSAIHDFMLANGYFILNLDYDGRGHFANQAVDASGKYGILVESDAVYLKRRAFLYEPASETDGELEARVLKYAAFCLNNSASDVALDVLLEARRDHGLDFDLLKKTKLYEYLDVAVHRLFYGLKWQPGQSIKNHKKIYSEIFNKRMKEMHQYNQSLQLNPN